MSGPYGPQQVPPQFPTGGVPPGYGYSQRYGAQPYGSQPYGAPSPRNGLGTAGLVLGIIGVVFFMVPYFGMILSILAVIFGGVGLSRVNNGVATNRGVAKAGLILGIIGVGLWILAVLAFFSAIGSISTSFNV